MIDPTDTVIWATRTMGRDDNQDHPENIQTEIEEFYRRGQTYLVKRRKEGSDRQMLTEIIEYSPDGVSPTVMKYAGTRFSDNVVRQFIACYQRGKAARFSEEALP